MEKLKTKTVYMLRRNGSGLCGGGSEEKSDYGREYCEKGAL